MTQYFVGPGGSDSADGSNWTNRKLTLTGAEALSLVAGDDVLVGPGIYRETLTLTKSGGNLYSTGTASVTNGSKVVAFSGSTLTSNAFAGGTFQIRTFVAGTDGVTNGTATFTSAGGTFQAGMVGYVLSIATKAAYRIATYVSVTEVTLENADGSAAAPTAGTGLTYQMAQPESVYDIASVDSNTQLTLAKPWSGPTLTGCPYRTTRPIRFIADVKGHQTDGIGGVVILTGSNDDVTQARTSVLSVNSRNYRTFRGFTFQLGNDTISVTTGSDLIVEDFLAQGGNNNSGVFNITGVTSGIVLRRGIIQGGRGVLFASFNASVSDNAAFMIENVLGYAGAAGGFQPGRYGNSLIRNCTVFGGGISSSNASPTAGQALVVTNCIFHSAGFSGVAATPEWLFEDYNAAFGWNTTAHSNTRVGAHTLTTNSPLLDPPILTGSGYVEPWKVGELLASAGATSPLRNKTSAPYPGEDLYGVSRPQGTLPAWGALEPMAKPVRETTIVRNGTSALKLPGRGYHAMLVPVTFGQAITLTAYVRWDSNASIGLKPRIRLLADYGVAEQEDVATGDGSTFEALSIGPITPAAPAVGNTDGGMMVLLLENQNTHTSDVAVYVDDVVVA